jgi:hypothetical protein
LFDKYAEILIIIDGWNYNIIRKGGDQSMKTEKGKYVQIQVTQRKTAMLTTLIGII